MIYPDVTVEEWCARYPGLAVVSDSCPGCSMPRVTTGPIAVGSYRGLISPPHQCGPRFDLLSVVSVDPDVSASWAAIYRSTRLIGDES